MTAFNQTYLPAAIDIIKAWENDDIKGVKAIWQAWLDDAEARGIKRTSVAKRHANKVRKHVQSLYTIENAAVPSGLIEMLITPKSYRIEATEGDRKRLTKPLVDITPEKYLAMMATIQQSLISSVNDDSPGQALYNAVRYMMAVQAALGMRFSEVAMYSRFEIINDRLVRFYGGSKARSAQESKDKTGECFVLLTDAQTVLAHLNDASEIWLNSLRDSDFDNPNKSPAECWQSRNGALITRICDEFYYQHGIYPQKGDKSHVGRGLHASVMYEIHKRYAPTSKKLNQLEFISRCLNQKVKGKGGGGAALNYQKFILSHEIDYEELGVWDADAICWF